MQTKSKHYEPRYLFSVLVLKMEFIKIIRFIVSLSQLFSNAIYSVLYLMITLLDSFPIIQLITGIYRLMSLN